MRPHLGLKLFKPAVAGCPLDPQGTCAPIQHFSPCPAGAAFIAGGCTKQACGFRDRIDEFTAAGYDVYGMSFDKPKSQVSGTQACWPDGWPDEPGARVIGLRALHSRRRPITEHRPATLQQ